MDSLTFDSSFSGKSLGTHCLVCGTLTLGNCIDLSLGSSRTSQSDTSIQNKLHNILLNLWVLPDSEDSLICISCFNLVDQFDILEGQLDAIRKDLTDKYASKIGIRSNVSNKSQFPTGTPAKRSDDVKRKRRQYIKKKKHTFEETNDCRPVSPDNSILNQQLEQSLGLHVNSNSIEAHSMSSELPWSQDSLHLQQLGDITVTSSQWKKIDTTQKTSAFQKDAQNQLASPNNLLTIYFDDPNFLNSGERLRIGNEVSDHTGASFVCVYCNQIALNIETLKTHFHALHCPKVLTSPIPVELGLGSFMNCGIQIENVNNAASDAVKPFACIFCDGSFKFKSNLNLHFKEKHTPNKPFICVECQDSFRRSMELSRHKVYYCPHRKKNLHRKEKKVK